MKTLQISIIIITSGVAISFLAYLLLFTATDKILWDSSTAANATASRYGIFHQEIDWHVHVTAGGTIHPVTDHHNIDENSIFSCSFSIIPNDARDHFAYLSVFRNNETGYVVAQDDQAHQVIDAKPVPLEIAVCGP